ncbi:MAG: alcohol dehydrogenase catalytic domain-containing protein, partial [Pseudomonadota bacterium]
MRAILAQSLDGPDGLAGVELPDPDPGSTPGPNEVIVRVAGCALNFMDTLITRGRYQIKPELPFSPGAEIGGTIERIGEAVTGYVVGDRVM